MSVLIGLSFKNTNRPDRITPRPRFVVACRSGAAGLLLDDRARP
jgi:hypothetical protein